MIDRSRLALPRADVFNVQPTRPQLDGLDRSIIEILQLDGRRSVASIARMLKQDRRTIAKKIESLLSANTIRFALATDPRALGYESMAIVCLTLKGDANAIEVYESVCQFPEASYVTLTTGKYAIQAEIVGRNDKELSQIIYNRFSRVEGIHSFEVLYCLSVYFQRTWFADEGEKPKDHGIRPFEADDIDRNLIQLLAKDGRSTFKAIASSLGVSESLVRKRYESLSNTNVLRVVAAANPLQLGFEVACWVAVRVGEDANVTRIAESLTKVPEVSYIAITAGSEDLMVQVVCKNTDHLLNLLDQRIRPIDGLAHVEVWMYIDLQHKAILPGKSSEI